MALPTGKPLTSLVRTALERACRDFTVRVELLGFQRSLKMFWTRRHPLTVEFIHFHRSGSSYHLRFNAETGSTYGRCVDGLARFITEQGEPSFQQWGSVDALLRDDSPMRATERAFLQAARDGEPYSAWGAASLKVLGIKEA